MQRLSSASVLCASHGLSSLACWNLLAYADLICPCESLRMDVSLFQQGGGLGMGRLPPAADGSGDSLPRKLIAQHSGTLISWLHGDAAESAVAKRPSICSVGVGGTDSPVHLPFLTQHTHSFTDSFIHSSLFIHTHTHSQRLIHSASYLFLSLHTYSCAYLPSYFIIQHPQAFATGQVTFSGDNDESCMFLPARSMEGRPVRKRCCGG